MNLPLTPDEIKPIVEAQIQRAVGDFVHVVNETLRKIPNWNVNTRSWVVEAKGISSVVRDAVTILFRDAGWDVTIEQRAGQYHKSLFFRFREEPVMHSEGPFR
jgi:hypothetical protein